jgi:N-acetylneuraminate synthase
MKRKEKDGKDLSFQKHRHIKIGNKTLDKPYVIAEFGVNHGNDIELAKKAIEAAAEAGADAIKFQTYTADELVCKGTPKFWEHESADGMNQHQAYEVLGGFPYEKYPELIKHCESVGIEFLSTPFSIEAADKLNEMGMKAFKIASSDMSYIPFLRHVARFGKPIFLSTGASTMKEIIESVEAILDEGNDKIVILHCILNYPTDNDDANLNVIKSLRNTFPECQVGFSDHTLGLAAPFIASALGAIVIEKHFTLDKTMKTTADHWLSVDPPELKALVQGVRAAQNMLGSGTRVVFDCEKHTREFDKRSIVSKVPIPKDTVITEEMITFKRPGTGLWPSHKDMVVGSIAVKNIPADVPIKFGMI